MLSDAFIRVHCDDDDCSAEAEIELCATARGWDDRGLDADIEGIGWSIKGDSHYCPDCSEREDSHG